MNNEELLLLSENNIKQSVKLSIDNNDPKIIHFQSYQDNDSLFSKETTRFSSYININQKLIDKLNSYNIYVIESVTAGKNTSFDFYNLIFKKLLINFGINHIHFQTEKASSINEFAKSFCNENNDDNNKNKENSNYLFIFLSGDTSIFEFINSFYYQFHNTSLIPNITILPFPQGTGNALSNSLNINNNLIAIKKFFEANQRHLPLYQLQSFKNLKSINPSLSSFTKNKSILFMIVASWGLHSTLVYESDKPEMRLNYGSERFKIAAEKILEANPVFKGRISINNNSENKSLIFNKISQSWELSTIINTSDNNNIQDLSYFLLAAVSNFEETFVISPDSIVENDQLHVVSIPYVPSNIIMNLMMDAYNKGSHIESNLVYYKPIASSLTLEIENTMDPSLSIICLDGSSWSVVGDDRKLIFSLLPQSFLKVLA
jgi:diacylglycerol kinase family enzyme